MTDAQIISALRCSSSVVDAPNCSECPYQVEEQFMGDTITSCDVDRIGHDAADRLEELTSQRTHTLSPADTSAAQYADNPVLAEA